MLKKMLNEKELSKLTGMSLSRIRQDRHKKRGIPYIKMGRAVFYIDTDVDSFVYAHRIDTQKKTKNDQEK